MKIEEMSAEKLLDALCSACNDYIAGVKYSPEYQKVISRLTRGDKAIKAIVNKDIRAMADIEKQYRRENEHLNARTA